MCTHSACWICRRYRWYRCFIRFSGHLLEENIKINIYKLRPLCDITGEFSLKKARAVFEAATDVSAVCCKSVCRSIKGLSIDALVELGAAVWDNAAAAALIPSLVTWGITVGSQFPLSLMGLRPLWLLETLCWFFPFMLEHEGFDAWCTTCLIRASELALSMNRYITLWLF